MKPQIDLTDTEIQMIRHAFLHDGWLMSASTFHSSAISTLQDKNILKEIKLEVFNEDCLFLTEYGIELGEVIKSADVL